MMTHLDLTASQIDVLIDLYGETRGALDDLPYSDQFEELYSQFQRRARVVIDRNYVWKALCNARKASKLLRKERKAATRATRGVQVSPAGRKKKAKPKARALSIRQPFAEQILTGDKEVEYRSRRTHIRGRVYIYASKAPGDADSYEEAGYEVDELPRGVLVGTVELVDCTGEEGDFEWHLANPQRLRSPLAVEGMPQPGFFWPFGH